MTQKQRWVAAADMLTSAQQAEGAKAMPSDDLIDTFKGGVTTACVVDTMNIGEVGALLYVSERTRFGP